MAVRIITAFVFSVAPVQGAATAHREAPRCTAADPTVCAPPSTTPWDLVPPGTHCLELLPYAMEAGIAPEDYEWFGNVSWGESHCRPDAHNSQLPGGVWGPMQISYGSWRRLCGLTSPTELYDPTTTFRCAQTIAAAAGRRQWVPHDPVTGCLPRGVGVQC